MGSSSARVTYGTSQVLLVGGQVVFLGDLPFSPHLTTDLAQNELNNINSPNHIKKPVKAKFHVEPLNGLGEQKFV